MKKILVLLLIMLALLTTCGLITRGSNPEEGSLILNIISPAFSIARTIEPPLDMTIASYQVFGE